MDSEGIEPSSPTLRELHSYSDFELRIQNSIDALLPVVHIERNQHQSTHHRLQVQWRALHTDDWSDETCLPVPLTSEDRNLVDIDTFGGPTGSRTRISDLGDLRLIR